ncbi:DUF1801 domain-containing protein [Paenibacillus beijingensis]|uniref:YdhG-like domain-containing protein n=1 Tax=Paenibacillus beijingensis TaxID=1126833 RepID=A0A0D5NE39_9BACL|nr:DUF1801 domain-containing protein [Paenibacillus beijingensis]AJY73521.1 hypothetical protein VN24_01385 [Paenibacillus beijingensis]
MNQEVTDFINNVNQSWQVNIGSQLRQIVHQSIPDVEERIQYRKPHFLKNGKYAAVISTAKDTVSFTIFNAAELELPEGLFDGPPERKTIKFRNGQTVDDELLTKLLKQASSSL